MKLVADQQELAAGIGWVAKGLPHRTSTPILLGLLLTAGPDRATIAGTDHAISTQLALDCQVDAEGTCLVPGRMLAEIVKLLPPGPVTLAAADNRFTVRCGDAVYTLPLLPVIDYPATTDAEAEHRAAVDAAEFAAAVGQVAVSAARDDVVPALAGINLSFADETVELASTDRYRLGIARVGLTSPVQPFDVLVPAKALVDLTRAFAADGGQLLLSVADETLLLHNLTRSARVRTLSGPYLPYRRIVPDETPIRATVERAALRDVVKRLSVVADGMTPIWLEYGVGSLRVRAGSADDASGAETLAASGTGDSLTVAFTGQLLLDAINSFGTSHLTASYTGARKPAVLTGATETGEPDGDYLHVVTPRLLPQQ
ncbi:DNA polymerase III subunit beta [Kribbella sp. ALI-6-A]|uniref:DNA polymerase III subunit beta n=1 Tax=Kribbella sp. ALI-6-A TaxID=1933817 RepID=UPI00097CBA4F|nr:DNA polymerase III subunit beta [Kribbella sp. ALI-6-A]ONI69909.1 DNA polymerase III subunit beta [Kribbella sp. ALI-6-A]